MNYQYYQTILERIKKDKVPEDKLLMNAKVLFLKSQQRYEEALSLYTADQIVYSLPLLHNLNRRTIPLS